MRTGNDEIMNANYDLGDQQTLTDEVQTKQEPCKVPSALLEVKDL